jgi:hypothetical protein
MSRYTLKSSTVFVSVGEETRVFRSVEDVPSEWIQYFEQSRGRLRPETILIADPKGREEILRGLQGLPSSVKPRWNSASMRPVRNLPAGGRSSGLRLSPRQVAAEASLAAMIGVAIVLAFWFS